jgi:8-oxo-dGTP diphosphatase
MIKNMYEDGYMPPILTVDTVLFQLVDDELLVLLIQRAREPFKGRWALPGGYNGAGETTRDAMNRIMKAKAGIDTNKLQYLEQLYTFDTVARDPRGHAVSVTYMGLGRDLSPIENKNTQQPGFFPVNNLPDLAYDHEHIIRYSHERLSYKITYTNAVFALLPKLFTLSQLQTAYETIFGRELDKRNFRKKFLGLDLIQPTDEYVREGAHRPARLHRFNSQKLEVLTRSFD